MHAWGFVVSMTRGYAGYAALWEDLRHYWVILDALLLVSVVLAGSRNFRRGAQLAGWLSAILLILAGAITFVVSRARGKFPDDLVSLAMFCERNLAIFGVVFTAFAIFAFTRLAHGAPLRRNSILILRYTMVFFTASFLGSQIFLAGRDYASVAVAQCFIMGGPLVTFGVLACKLNQGGEIHKEPSPPESGAVQQSEDGLRDALRGLREMGRRG
jgi:hypothetical protein